MAVQDWTSYVKILPQGARIQEFKINGHNLVLGFNDAADYNHDFNPFFGETIGRVANRIADAEIKQLNGRSYQLAVNNGPTSLHGGREGWGRKTFDGPHTVSRDGRQAVLLTYLSLDGDEGYPGTVELKVWYFLNVQTKDGRDQIVELELEYEAKLVGDEVGETAINVTNHSYFNVSGNATIEGTNVTLPSVLHQPVDDVAIPTGEITPFPGLEKDETFILGATEPDIDHCFIVNDRPETVKLDTRSQSLQKLCELYHPSTGIRLEAFSTEPAFQFYTGKFIDVPAINGKPARDARSGLCIEASRYVNAINVDAWRSMVLLKRGQTYGSRTIYRASSS